MNRLRASFLIAVFISTASLGATSSLSTLGKGFNISGWFKGCKACETAYLEGFLADSDFTAMHQLGIKHVRILVEPEVVLSAKYPDSRGPIRKELITAVSNLISKGFAVVIAPDPNQENALSLKESDPQYATFAKNYYPAFLAKLSSSLASFPTDKLFLEVLNEPPMAKTGPKDDSPDRWVKIAHQYIALIRQRMPKHTLISSGPGWSSTLSLIGTTNYASAGIPVDSSWSQSYPELIADSDPNIIYSIHIYEPTIFTHQGATFMVPFRDRGILSGVPFPYPSTNPAEASFVSDADRLFRGCGTQKAPCSDDQKLAYLMPTMKLCESTGGAPKSSSHSMTNAVSEIKNCAISRLQSYHQQGWTPASLARIVDAAQTWSQKYNRPIMVGEFGAMSDSVPPSDRANYLGAISQSAEGSGMSWANHCYSDYDGGFGLFHFNCKNGNRVLDENARAALHLNEVTPELRSFLASAIKQHTCH